MQTQLQMYEEARRKLAAANQTFVEIMTGANPLTPDELRRLIGKHPSLWKRYEKFAE